MDISSLSYDSSLAGRKPDSSSSLDKDAFLNLIVTQMQNQNPLEPTSATDFMAQLTQMGTLEGVQNINTTLTDLFGSASPDAMARAAQLVGHRIEYLDPDSGEVLPGLVSSVSKDSSGEVVLDIGASMPVRLSDVVRILDGSMTGEG